MDIDADSFTRPSQQNRKRQASSPTSSSSSPAKSTRTSQKQSSASKSNNQKEDVRVGDGTDNIDNNNNVVENPNSTTATTTSTTLEETATSEPPPATSTTTAIDHQQPTNITEAITAAISSAPPTTNANANAPNFEHDHSIISSNIFEDPRNIRNELNDVYRRLGTLEMAYTQMNKEFDNVRLQIQTLISSNNESDKNSADVFRNLFATPGGVQDAATSLANPLTDPSIKPEAFLTSSATSGPTATTATVDRTGGGGSAGGRLIGGGRHSQSSNLHTHANSPSPSLDIKDRSRRQGTKSRKPHLSKAVRHTIFRMLDLAVAGHRFHGYANAPELPEYSPEPLYNDKNERIWRWDWSKTIKGSAHNAEFASAVRSQLIKEREAGKWNEVPEDDWLDLDTAIETAYINLRREKDSQTNPIKTEKKMLHRARNKRRGLKDEKSKRRRTAWNSLTKNNAAQELLNLAEIPEGTDISEAFDIRYMSSDESDKDSSSLIEPGSPASSSSPSTRLRNDNNNTTNNNNNNENDQSELKNDVSVVDPVLDGSFVDPSLDVTSIQNATATSTPRSSSAHAHVPGTASPPGSSLSSNLRRGPRPLSAQHGTAEKIFKVRKPAWRSDNINCLYSHLDKVKMPERAFKRVPGEPRESNPPAGTPEWMIDQTWKVSNNYNPDDNNNDNGTPF